MIYSLPTRQLRELLNAHHHNIKLGIHYGYPDRLEGYIPGLGLDPVPLTPDEVLAAARAWPEYDWLAQ